MQCSGKTKEGKKCQHICDGRKKRCWQHTPRSKKQTGGGGIRMTVTFMQNEHYMNAPYNTCLKVGNIDNLDDWFSLLEMCNLDYDIGSVTVYNNPTYHLVSAEQFKKLTFQIQTYYQNYYINQEHWDKVIQTETWKVSKNHDPYFVEKMEIPPNSRIVVCGDLHSSLTSFLNIVAQMRDQNLFSNFGEFKLKRTTYLFFCGDIVDRGPWSIELMYLIFKLKLTNPNNVFIINGNHEDQTVWEKYGLANEVLGQFKNERPIDYLYFLHFLPSAIFIKLNNTYYQLCHGAIPEKVIYINSITNFLKNNKKFLLLSENSISSGLGSVQNQLKWGDATSSYNDYEYIRDLSNHDIRRAGGRFVFYKNVIMEYLQRTGIKMIISGHQDLSNFLMIFKTDNPDMSIYEVDDVYNNGLVKDNLLYRFNDYVENIYTEKPFKKNVDLDEVIFLTISSAYQSKKREGSLDFDTYLMIN